jgi:hypothetical protein
VRPAAFEEGQLLSREDGAALRASVLDSAELLQQARGVAPTLGTSHNSKQVARTGL